VALLAVACYASTATDFFLQDDFGVVGLLSQKPALFFPHWFVMPWTENIWGYSPDELRPFPAVSYQISSIFGSGGSPVPDHVINIAIHAANGALVFAIAQEAAGIGLVAAAFAGAVFVVLPIDAESVAWLTGRVDSLPACFYFAAFLFYVRWRTGGRPAAYGSAIAFFFLALFTKQNTITLAPALVLYDLIVARRPIEVSWRWLRPYVPFIVMTAAFLGLRYAIFHVAAREDALTAQRVQDFLSDVSRHLARLVFGGSGIRHWTIRDSAVLIAGGALIAMLASRFARGSASTLWRPAVYFGMVWLALGIAPILVSGYYSPRHMYLAALGWAVLLGIAFQVLLSCSAGLYGSRGKYVQAVVGTIAMLVVGAYTIQLLAVVRDWHRRAAVSHQALGDVEREALASPQGSLILVGVGTESWAFAVPHAFKPPFTTEDLTQRVSVISDSSLHCCAASQWNEYTRDALRRWAANPAQPPVVAMYWDPRTTRRSRVTDRDDPQLRTVMVQLLETDSRATLDSAIRSFLQNFVAGH
jgi:hypothetical protein